MEAYTGFAAVYDTFMDNVPYREWGEYIHCMLCKYDVKDGLVLDLGCGTGTMTEILAGYGYDMIGADNSEDMLELAMEKRIQSGYDILYLLQDMREFELYGTVRAVVSVCDSVNYITDPEDLEKVFRLVNNYLDPGGLFLFDLNTIYKYEKLLGDSTIAENRPEGSFIWDNEYDPESRINVYELALFIPREDGLYEKYEEEHYQRAYTLEKIQSLLRQAGMEYVTAYDAFTEEPPREGSERIYILARESGKAENCKEGEN